MFAKVTQDVKEWIQSIAQTQDSDCSSTKPTTTTESPSPSLNKTIELVGGENRKEGNVLLYGKPIWYESIVVFYNVCFKCLKILTVMTIGMLMMPKLLAEC